MKEQRKSEDMDLTEKIRKKRKCDRGLRRKWKEMKLSKVVFE